MRFDGVKVGDSKPGGFFFVDSTAGNHTVSVSTELEKKLTFTLDKSEAKYIKTSPSFGVLAGRIIPELVDAEQARKELSDLSYTGAESAANDSSSNMAMGEHRRRAK